MYWHSSFEESQPFIVHSIGGIIYLRMWENLFACVEDTDLFGPSVELSHAASELRGDSAVR
jgi:hypothetical protein